MNSVNKTERTQRRRRRRRSDEIKIASRSSIHKPTTTPEEAESVHRLVCGLVLPGECREKENKSKSSVDHCCTATHKDKSISLHHTIEKTDNMSLHIKTKTKEKKREKRNTVDIHTYTDDCQQEKRRQSIDNKKLQDTDENGRTALPRSLLWTGRLHRKKTTKYW